LKEKREKLKGEKQKRSLLKDLLGMLTYVGVVCVITVLIITYVGQRTHVSGSSMENTLSHGDNLIVDKITYRLREPQRFDIIVFPFQREPEIYYIKRIIGMPGETVQIIDGAVFIDGERLWESYGREVIRDAGQAKDPVTLGEDEYFVMGDNRNASADSRDPSVGVISRERILGRAWLRIWPLRDMEIISHR